MGTKVKRAPARAKRSTVSHTAVKTVNSRAVKKLRGMLEGEKKSESVLSLSKKLGVARGTLQGIVAGITEPRLHVILAAKALGIEPEDWERAA